MRKRFKLLTSIILVSVISISAYFLTKPAFATPGVLPPPNTLNMTTSSRDAYARYQTITYNATVIKPGKLTHIVMTLPAGAFAGDVRSSSGTVAPYRSGQIIWRPAAPINVVAGTKLKIPVVGINYYRPGTTNMWLTASDAVGEVLAYARGDFVLNNPAIGCKATGNDYIQRENAQTGAPAGEWQIDQAKFAPDTFSGFANAESYKCSDIAYFKVDSKLTSSATATVYRMGYYGGTGARKIWSTEDFFLTGKQPAPKIVNTTNPAVQRMVDASNWKYNLGIRIDGRFTPGVYLVKISDKGGREAYIPFTVRDDSGVKHAFMLQQATTTWQAYNKYGGYSFYAPSGAGSSHLSFNRPYSEPEGKGSGQFLQLESGLVYWMEKNNYDVSYWTDADLQTNPNALSSRTRNLIIPAHDEYYSDTMRNAVIAGINSTVNLISLGANQIHRPISYSSDKRSFEVEGKITGGYTKSTFRSRGPVHTEQNIMGAQYGCRSNGDLIANTSWMWNGVAPGTVLEGFVNGESDYVNTYDYLNKYKVPVPEGNKVLTSATLDFCAIAQEPERMDIVARTTPAGTRVFGGSTFSYSCFLNNSCYKSWPGRGAEFDVDQADSDAVGKVISNVFRWADTGAELPPI